MAAGHRRRSRPAGVPAQAEADRQQDGGLEQLDGDDGDDLGSEQTGPAERRRAQPLQHPVAALEAGGDPERDHGRRHDGQRQDAGYEEVDRRGRGGGDDGDLGEEEEEDDGDAQREQEGLPAAQGHEDLGAGLRGERARPHRRPRRRRRPRGVVGSASVAGSTARAPTTSK